MTQSYKVFIGSAFIQFVHGAENDGILYNRLINPSSEKLLQIIEGLETGHAQNMLVSGNIPLNWNNFIAHFKIVEAAGGLVENQQGEWLFIFRNGMWDLPKGKLEKGESVEQCAVREVAEECGIAEPTIVRSLQTTYHTYELKGQRILKPTYWFLMKSSDANKLIPQTEEGVSEVKWVSTAEAQRLASNSFGSIKQVVSEGLLSAN